jgi:hypothetical protein
MNNVCSVISGNIEEDIWICFVYNLTFCIIWQAAVIAYFVFRVRINSDRPVGISYTQSSLLDKTTSGTSSQQLNSKTNKSSKKSSKTGSM